jgi:hypothetical protein
LHEKFPIAINRLAPELHVKILDRLKDPHDRLVYLSGRLRVCNDLNNPVADLPQFIHETANQVCELMCQLKQPESEILLFVQRVANEKLLRSLLTVLKRYDVFEPIIWILQTIGDEREAIKLVRDRLMRLPATSPVPEQLSGLSERLLDTGMQVCRHFSASQQRCEQVPQGKQQDNPWFLLLDAFIAFQGSLESPDPSSFVKQSLDQSLQKLLAAMMSHVQDIVGVIYRLMMDGTAQEKPLIDYKDLLLSVLSAHDNQRAILQSTAQIGEWFAVQSLSLRYAKQRKFRPVKSGDVCVSCSRRLVQPMAAGIHSNSSSSSRDTGLFLLGCGHIFHGKCLLLGCNAINNSQQLECPYCGVAILSSSQLSLFSDTGATAADEKLRRQVEAFYLYTAAHQKRKLDSRNS